MKITIVFHTSPRTAGGGTKILYEYANILSMKGHNIELAYMANQLWSKKHLPEQIRKIMARISIQIRPRWFKLDVNIKKYALFSVDNQNVHDADVVIATDVRTAKPVSKLSNRKGEKFYFIQGFENWSLPDENVYETYTLGMNNITVSNWLSELVDQYSDKPSICISNSINTDVFKVDVPIDKRKPHSIAFHYRSIPIKGCEYAFETIQILENRYPDLEVTVVGIEDEPQGMPKCCKYVRRASQQEVANINNNVAVFICSSIKEGFGLPGLEAMACGCALAASNYQAIKEYAEDGKTAVISPVKDAKAMADNIIKLFEDDEYRVKIAKKAAEVASRRSLEVAADRFEKAICKKRKREV